MADPISSLIGGIAGGAGGEAGGDLLGEVLGGGAGAGDPESMIVDVVGKMLGLNQTDLGIAKAALGAVTGDPMAVAAGVGETVMGLAKGQDPFAPLQGHTDDAHAGHTDNDVAGHTDNDVAGKIG